MPDSQPEARDDAPRPTPVPAAIDDPSPGAAERPAPAERAGAVGRHAGALPIAAEQVVPTGPIPLDKQGLPGKRGLQRNPILAELVQGEDDLAGLVGYGFYKLNKRDWLAAFFKTHGRDPTEGEIESYVLGERTQRRLATYRRLAEDLIGRKSASIEKPGAPAVTSAQAALQRVSALKAGSLRSSLAPAAPPKPTTHPKRSVKASLIFWIVVLVVLAAAGYYYVNYSTLFLGR